MTLNLEHKRLDLPFIIGLLATLFLPYTLFYFAPFLIMTIYQKPLKNCLWAALGAGVVIDLLASYHQFGLTALNYCLCTLILYPQKRHFFADRITTLPLMTYLFASLSLGIHFIFQQILEKPVPLAWQWVVTDMGLMPLFDALYALIIYTVPPLLMGQRPKRGTDYFLS